MLPTPYPPQPRHPATLITHNGLTLRIADDRDQPGAEVRTGAGTRHLLSVMDAARAMAERDRGRD